MAQNWCLHMLRQKFTKIDLGSVKVSCILVVLSNYILCVGVFCLRDHHTGPGVFGTCPDHHTGPGVFGTCSDSITSNGSGFLGWPNLFHNKLYKYTILVKSLHSYFRFTGSIRNIDFDHFTLHNRCVIVCYHSIFCSKIDSLVKNRVFIVNIWFHQWSKV